MIYAKTSVRNSIFTYDIGYKEDITIKHVKVTTYAPFSSAASWNSPVKGIYNHAIGEDCFLTAYITAAYYHKCYV